VGVGRGDSAGDGAGDGVGLGGVEAAFEPAETSAGFAIFAICASWAWAAHPMARQSANAANLSIRLKPTPRGKSVETKVWDESQAGLLEAFVIEEEQPSQPPFCGPGRR
jgi:hypothetical protein